MDHHEGGTIFLLDDDRTVLEAAKRALEPLGLPLVASQLWSEIARPLIQAGAGPAVLVCDLDLPGIRGSEFCRIVRRHNPRVRIVIFTSQPDDAPKDIAQAIVDKKSGLGALLRAIRELLARPAPEEAPAKEAAGAKQLRVLLVEDEAAQRRFMRLALERAGYTVNEADRVAPALSALEACDMVVSDVRMPGGGSGLDVLASAKKRTPPLPVVLVSAFGDAETLRTALRLHCDAFLDKPFKPAQLVSAVAGALALRGGPVAGKKAGEA